MKLVHIIIFYLLSLPVVGQITYRGMVMDSEGGTLPGASIVIKNTTRGVITDEGGHFAIEASPQDSIIVSFVGYQPDTLLIKNHIHVKLEQENLDEVVVRGKSSAIDELDPINKMVITEKELTKAACCNLSESFETNASVDVSYADAVTGAKQIQMLGLDGLYVQTNRENIPNIRGLSSRFGLGYIPGTWIQAIDVGKGAGSVVTGYESMTGQINVELKKPESMEQFYANTYINQAGRFELNLHGAKQLNERVSTGLFVHGNYLNNDIDRNEDGFQDIPKSRQLNVLNRWKYEGDRVMSQVGVNFLVDNKAGGETAFNWNDNANSSSLYGYENLTYKAEVFGKIGVLYPKKPYRGIGIIYSGSVQDINASFGRRSYTGQEQTAYTNFIYQSIIDNSFHTFKTGVSFLYDNFDEVLADSAYSRTEVVPGAFFEYTYMPSEKFILVAGLRNDYHSIYGNQFTPRLHFKYDLLKNTSVRLSAGRGFRVPNPIAENTGILVSSRDIVMDEKLKPEVSWNYGISISNELLESGLSFILDYYYTDFENQLVVDLDREASKAYFNNLTDESSAHSFQVEGTYEVSEAMDIKIAYKYYDVMTILDGQRQQVPFISKNRFFVNASYATKYDIWKFDLTGQWYGPQRLPATSDKPEQYQLESFSPGYFKLNAQVNKAFRWGEIYLGGENLLNFRQDNPVLAPNDPFGPHFDASLNWGPVMGRMLYAGFRYKID